MNKFDKVLRIIFYITTILYALEFIFVRGMFTTFIMGGLMIFLGVIILIREVMKKNYKACAIYGVILAVVITEFILIFSGVIA